MNGHIYRRFIIPLQLQVVAYYNTFFFSSRIYALRLIVQVPYNCIA